MRVQARPEGADLIIGQRARAKSAVYAVIERRERLQPGTVKKGLDRRKKRLATLTVGDTTAGDVPSPCRTLGRNMATLKTLSNNADTGDRIISSRELHESIVPWDRHTTWKLTRAGKFPAPIQITSALRGWRWSTIRAWMDEREANPSEQRAYFPKKKMVAAARTKGR